MSIRYVPQLDGLRAVCVSFTILNHVGSHPEILNGNVGVDGFFVLSGFLITSLLAAEYRATADICLKCFYIRRGFRIVPLYYCTIGLYALSSAVLTASRVDPGRWSEFLAAAPATLFFMGEYRPPGAGSVLGHAWTLGIEEKYYLVWPVMLLRLQRCMPYARYGIMIGIVGFSWLMLPETLESRGYGGLAIGSLLGLVLADPNQSAARRILAVPTYAYLAAVAAGYWLVVMFSGGRIHVVFTLAAGLLICSLVARPSALSRVLSAPALTFVGRRSYSMYLVHVLIANAAVMMLRGTPLARTWYVIFGLAFAASLAVACGSKVALEDRMIAVGKAWAARVGSNMGTADARNRIG